MYQQRREGLAIAALAMAIMALVATPAAEAQSSVDYPLQPNLVGSVFWLDGPGRTLTINSQQPDGTFQGVISNYTVYPTRWSSPNFVGSMAPVRSQPLGWYQGQLGAPPPLRSWIGSDPVQGRLGPFFGRGYLITFSYQNLMPPRRWVYTGRLQYDWTTGTFGGMTGSYVVEARPLTVLGDWQIVEGPTPFVGTLHGS